MPDNDHDRLLAELRRVLNANDPVPLPVAQAARDALRWPGGEPEEGAPDAAAPRPPPTRPPGDATD
jgi:hypothetical protein